MTEHEPVAAALSRRTLLRTATVAGGLVWATPVVQSLAAPAHAAGTPPPGLGTGLSYVAVLLKLGSTIYRIKYEADTKKVSIVDFQTPACGTFPAETQVADGKPAATVVRSATFSGGSFQLVLKSGVELVDWVAKQGVCCISKATGESVGYVVAEAPAAPGTLTKTYVFPPAPERQPCSLLAPKATSTPSRAGATVVQTTPAATTTATTKAP